MHQLSTGRSARNFKDPLKFVPERWLKDEPRASDEAAASAPQLSSQYSTNDEFSLRYGNDDFAASQPFAIGSRGCLGKVIYFSFPTSLYRLTRTNSILQTESGLCGNAVYHGPTRLEFRHGTTAGFAQLGSTESLRVVE